jgi:hypothetical protein
MPDKQWSIRTDEPMKVFTSSVPCSSILLFLLFICSYIFLFFHLPLRIYQKEGTKIVVQ